MSTALLYMPMPHWKVSERASPVGISIRTGVLSGSSFSILSSGKTTCVAHVWSVVRTKTSDAGFPFSSLTSLGAKPLEPTLISDCWVPSAGGGTTTSGSAFELPSLEQPPRSGKATRASDTNLLARRDMPTLLPSAARNARRPAWTLPADHVPFSPLAELCHRPDSLRPLRSHRHRQAHPCFDASPRRGPHPPCSIAPHARPA